MNKKITNKNTVRLFVSSTFQDMTEERDLLNKIIFPHLREFCKKRGLRFIGIDLRWGITEEDSEEKKTLKICLDEIERCRPYFAGIIGNRYGWIPPKEFFEQSGKIFDEGISITESEILTGAFSGEKARAVFCLKKTDASQSEIELEKQSKLVALCEKIKMSDYPKLFDYESPIEIVNFIITKFIQFIDEDFPIVLEKDAFQLEHERQRFLLDSYVECFYGREKELTSIVKNVDKGGKLLFLNGSVGIGKSALIAKLITDWEATNTDNFVFFCFKEALLLRSDWRFTIIRLIRELNAKMSRQYPELQTDSEIIAEFTNSIQIARKVLLKVLIAIDGVEQITDDSRYGFSWIPFHIPQNVSIVLTSNDDSTKERILQRKNKQISIKPLTMVESRSVAEKHLQLYGKKLDKRYFPIILSCVQSGNPLYLHIVLSELVLWNKFETLYDRIVYYMNSNSFESLFEKVLTRLEDDYGARLIANTLTLLYASNAGLSETEMMNILEVKQGEWFPVFHAIKLHLLESHGIYYLANTHLKCVIEKRYITAKKLITAKQKIVRIVQKSLEEKRCLWLAVSLNDDLNNYIKIKRLFDSSIHFTNMWQTNRYQTLKYYNLLKKQNIGNKNELFNRFVQRKNIKDLEFLSVAEFYLQIGEWENAASVLDKLLITKNISTTVVLKALALKGNIFIRLGDYKQAQKVFEYKKQICKKFKDEIEYARTEASLGLIQSYRNEYKRSIRKYTHAIRIFKRNHYPEGIQAALGNIGNAYLNMGKFSKSTKYFNKQERFCRETNNQNGIFSAMSGLFAVALKANIDNIEMILEKQLDICNEYGNISGLAIVYGNMAIVECKKGNFTKAMDLLNQKYELACRMNSFESKNVALANLADIDFLNNDILSAIIRTKERVKLCKKERNLTALCAALYRLAFFYKKNEQSEECSLSELEAKILEITHDVYHIEDKENHLLIPLKKEV
jgi:tetratricopeptide (TPR) repeat protein